MFTDPRCAKEFVVPKNAEFSVEHELTAALMSRFAPLDPVIGSRQQRMLGGNSRC